MCKYLITTTTDKTAIKCYLPIFKNKEKKIYDKLDQQL